MAIDRQFLEAAQVDLATKQLLHALLDAADNAIDGATADNDTTGKAAILGTDGALSVAGPLSAPSVVGNGATLANAFWVDVAVPAAGLAEAAEVVVVAGAEGAQYKIRDIILVGGGTNFAAAGDRLLDLTDGTTVFTQIANADLESAPTASLKWGNAKVPLLTGTSNTKTADGADLVFKYSGGTTDHATGSITFSVCLEKTD